jgi:hypothetical protein
MQGVAECGSATSGSKPEVKRFPKVGGTEAPPVLPQALGQHTARKDISTYLHIDYVPAYVGTQVRHLSCRTPCHPNVTHTRDGYCSCQVFMQHL